MELIKPDWTFFIQIGIFLFLVIFLSKVLFKPVIKVMDAREDMHKGPRAKAAELEKKVETLKEEVYGAIALAKEGAEKTRLDVLSGARETESRILEDNKKEVSEFLDKSRKDILAQVENASKELEKEGEKLGKVLADKLVASGQKGEGS